MKSAGIIDHLPLPLDEEFDLVANRESVEATIGSDADCRSEYGYDDLDRLVSRGQQGRTGSNGVVGHC